MSDTPVGSPAAPAETVVRLPNDTTGGIRILQTEIVPRGIPRTQYKSAGANAMAPVFDIDRLYEAPAGSESQMVTALGLLAESVRLLDQARLEVNYDAISSDRLVQQVQVLLDQLFACRRMGDGFGLIINSLHFAFVNLQGRPLTSRQLNAVWRVMKELRTRPVLLFDQAIQYVTELEETGLEVDPSILGELLESADDDQSFR